jgi:hypothetical protein
VAVAALDVDVASVEEDVDGLANTIEQVVRCGFGANAVQFGANEAGAFLAHELALALLPCAAGKRFPRLQDVEARGAGVLGHQGPRPKVLQRFDVLLRQSEAEPGKILRDMVQYRIARDA